MTRDEDPDGDPTSATDAVEDASEHWDPWDDWQGWDEAYAGSDPRRRRLLAGDAPTPRWAPDRPLGERITRVGRWKDIDPLQQGRLWNHREWAAFGLWGTLIAGAFTIAYRRRED